jgi:hypothetical protein
VLQDNQPKSYFHLRRLEEKDKTKKEHVEEMMNTTFGAAEGCNALLKMLLQDLQKSASNLGLDTKKHVRHQTVSGWEGRGKEKLQVLWEHGWINVNKLLEYKLLLQDDLEFIKKDYSFSVLMATCTDFENETSQLEFVCQSLGIEALITTKYHAEYAGEVIEYPWGAFKVVYHRYP